MNAVRKPNCLHTGRPIESSDIDREVDLQPHYQEHSLNGLDSRRIEAFWSFRPEQRAYHKVLPDGRIDLLVRFKLKDNGSITDVRPIIAGPAGRYATVPAGPGTGFFGVRFRPGWGGACLRIGPAGIRDTALVGNDALPVLGLLATPLLRASTVDQLKCRLIRTAQTLAARAQQNLPHARVIAAVDLLDKSGGKQPVAALAEDIGISVRTLHRDFSAAVGLSAKTFASILRFQRTMRLALARPSIQLAELAFSGGYSDQAHMTREFRDLGGFTPGARPDVPVINLAI